MPAHSSFRSLRPQSRRWWLAVPAAFGALACGSASAIAGPEPLPPVRPIERAATLEELIAEASRRFGVPESWIAEVMSVESRGRAAALSPKGAIGLMQVMPDTYADMRARHSLGANPWDRRDNVLAGTAYLRLLYDRYGAPGFLVAYNAGPGRWDDYRLRARPLPAETVAYLARLGPVVGGSVLRLPTFAGWAAPRSPLASSIFVRLASAPGAFPMSSERERIVRIIDANTAVIRPANAIFVARPRTPETPTDERSIDGSAVVPMSPGSSSAAASTRPMPPRNPLFPERATSGSQQ